MNFVNNRQINPKMITFTEEDLGFFQRLITGAIPLLSKVNLNHPRYNKIRPPKPKTPLLNERESHGPAGAISANVCTTNSKPTIEKIVACCFGCITMLRGLGLKACGIERSTMAEIVDAVLVAGGLGTRMLPASASIAKEALPLVDIPVLTHLAREAVAAGAKRLHIITSARKDLSALLADNSWLLDKRSDLDPIVLSPFIDVEVLVHIQHQALGLANAISTASTSINGPFLVLLGDNLVMDKHTSGSDYQASSASAELVKCFAQHKLPCVGLIAVNDDEVCNYGVVEMEGQRITSIVEKPQKEDAPSNMVLCGRYIFTEDFSQLLNQYSLEEYGELQSIAIQQHWMENNGLNGVLLNDYQWYDSGSPLPWLKAQIDHALRRPELSDELNSWLQQRLQ